MLSLIGGRVIPLCNLAPQVVVSTMDDVVRTMMPGALAGDWQPGDILRGGSLSAKSVVLVLAVKQVVHKQSNFRPDKTVTLYRGLFMIIQEYDGMRGATFSSLLETWPDTPVQRVDPEEVSDAC